MHNINFYFCLIFLLSIVSHDLCEEIADVRRRLQRMDKKYVLFLDETAVRENEAIRSTLTAPGEEPIALATSTTTYAHRYDMIACCSADKVFIPFIYSPTERVAAGLKGINTNVLLRYIHSTLGQEIAALEKKTIILVMDKASIHNKQKLIEALEEEHAAVVEIILMPTSSAKRLSPLDNSLFHLWKHKVRENAPLTDFNIVQIMSDEWNKISRRTLLAQYVHCGLERGKDPYFDCPQPSLHNHNMRI